MSLSKPLLANTDDVKILVQAFYQKALVDNKIGFIFTEIAQINIQEHIDLISDFWASVLFAQGAYKGNPIRTHMFLNQKIQLTTEHFDRWLSIWYETVDFLFEGEKALEAKNKALNIAQIMQFKLNSNRLFL